MMINMTQEQLYFAEGFIKRAQEYGFSEDEAIEILKEANEYQPPAITPDLGSQNEIFAPLGKLHKLNLGYQPQNLNGLQTGARLAKTLQKGVSDAVNNFKAIPRQIQNKARAFGGNLYSKWTKNSPEKPVWTTPTGRPTHDQSQSIQARDQAFDEYFAQNPVNAPIPMSGIRDTARELSRNQELQRQEQRYKLLQSLRELRNPGSQPPYYNPLLDRYEDAFGKPYFDSFEDRYRPYPAFPVGPYLRRYRRP
jgi:hypothetical protein